MNAVPLQEWQDFEHMKQDLTKQAFLETGRRAGNMKVQCHHQTNDRVAPKSISSAPGPSADGILNAATGRAGAR
jgi:hypothetical protein